MRSLNCLLVQNAHLVFCAGSLSIVQECVCAYSKTVFLKNIMSGSFPGYAFGSHFSKRFTHILEHIHDGTQPHINTHSPWAVHIQLF